MIQVVLEGLWLIVGLEGEESTQERARRFARLKTEIEPVFILA